jgi:hypothetical protein
MYGPQSSLSAAQVPVAQVPGFVCVEVPGVQVSVEHVVDGG